MTDIDKIQKKDALVDSIIGHLDDMKAEDIVLVDLKGLSSVADYFLIATGTSSVHVKAIADKLLLKLKERDGVRPWHVEGLDGRQWVLIDFIDVVVHIFDEETRQYYGLEQLWKDAEFNYIETG